MPEGRSRSGSTPEVTLDSTGTTPSTSPLATAAIAACSAVIPVMGVYRVLVHSSGSNQVIPAIVATVMILPIQLWLVIAAARGRSTARHRWGLAVIAAVILAATPVAGASWVGAVFPLSALVLVIVPRPYSVVVFAALVLVPIPLTSWLGEPSLAVYFSVGSLLYGLGVAIPIWLLAAGQRLRETRLALAHEAVMAERLRIDDELQGSVGTALAHIAAAGDRAAGMAATDPAAAASVVRALAERARGTMTEVRRLVRGYQRVPLGTEMRRVRRLLEAAGITTTVVRPAGPLPTTLDQPDREALWTRLAEVLAADGVRECICTVTVVQGHVRVDLRVDRPIQPSLSAA